MAKKPLKTLIAELNDLHRQEQILLNRLEHKLKGEK